MWHLFLLLDNSLSCMSSVLSCSPHPSGFFQWKLSFLSHCCQVLVHLILGVIAIQIKLNKFSCIATWSLISCFFLKKRLTALYIYSNCSLLVDFIKSRLVDWFYSLTSQPSCVPLSVCFYGKLIRYIYGYSSGQKCNLDLPKTAK